MKKSIKRKWLILKHGFKIHPGNDLYLILYCLFFGAGLMNATAPWWVGLPLNFLLVLLHLWTSYDVGKLNYQYRKEAD